MINKEISKYVLHIGTDLEEKGGIASLLKTYSHIYEQFNFINSHKFVNKPMQLVLLFIAILKMIYWCVFRKIKIVHLHAAAYNSFTRKTIFVFLAKLFRKKVVLHMHAGEFEPSYFKNKKIYDYSCNKADVIVSVSNGLKLLLSKYFDSSKIITIYNIVDKPLYDKNIKPLDKEIMNILFMGAINDNKGIFKVIEMWRINKLELAKRFKLTICGVGDSNKLKKLIQDNNLKQSVKYTGWVDKKQKNKLLANTDIYIQPSNFESLGIAIIEALSYGIPVIATKTGGIPELITDSHNGYLIEVGDMKDLKDKLNLIYDNKEDMQRLENNAYSTAKRFYSNSIENDIIKLYKLFI